MKHATLKRKILINWVGVKTIWYLQYDDDTLAK